MVTSAFIGAVVWTVLAAAKQAAGPSRWRSWSRWAPLAAVGLAVVLAFLPVEAVRALAGFVAEAPPELAGDGASRAAEGVAGGALATLLHAVVRTTVRGR